jgi:hypothetical protein
MVATAFVAERSRSPPATTLHITYINAAIPFLSIVNELYDKRYHIPPVTPTR